MVAIDQINRDAGLFEIEHLLVEEQRRLEALEAYVIEIAGDDEKIHFLRKSRSEHFLKGPPRGIADFVDRSARVIDQALKRGVEMNVRGVQEFHEAKV